jgi:hypothetical protein
MDGTRFDQRRLDLELDLELDLDLAFIRVQSAT